MHANVREVVAEDRGHPLLNGSGQRAAAAVADHRRSTGGVQRLALAIEHRGRIGRRARHLESEISRRGGGEVASRLGEASVYRRHFDAEVGARVDRARRGGDVGLGRFDGDIGRFAGDAHVGRREIDDRGRVRDVAGRDRPIGLLERVQHLHFVRVRLDLVRIGRARDLHAVAGLARREAALVALDDVGQLVRQDAIAGARARRVLTAPEIDVGPEREGIGLQRVGGRGGAAVGVDTHVREIATKRKLEPGQLLSGELRSPSGADRRHGAGAFEIHGHGVAHRAKHGLVRAHLLDLPADAAGREGQLAGDELVQAGRAERWPSGQRVLEDRVAEGALRPRARLALWSAWQHACFVLFGLTNTARYVRR